MTHQTDHSLAPRAVQQLRRVRAFYLAAALLWAVSAFWEGWWHPGGRQMWVSVAFLVIFTALLAMTSFWLRGRPVATPRPGGVRPADYAA
ncbi:hypothetical protein QQY24_29490 [Streptomyces sp. TG1A-8]|uniref:hypothetical protein n=1 Tax=Streptomyces sp. TG1A-8 TaxID=3051385 RepID=UPI00265B8C22|nr:hypothetical protein [Streptomyces sp. TG1A-8]MDO0929340.1 hypothetical protein [Streptomyces sp. TG1A-8]